MNTSATMLMKILLCVVFFVSAAGGDGHALCAFSKKENVKYHPSPGRQRAAEAEEAHTPHGQYVDGNGTEHCTKDSDSCYALWQEDPQNKSITILTQGCWDSSGDINCGKSDCIAYKKPSKALNNTKFCCCSGNLCNLNVTDGYVSPTPDLEQTPAWEAVNHMSYKTQIIIAVGAVVGFGVMVCITYLLARQYCNSPKRSNESLHLMEAPPPMSPNFDLDTLKIQETVGRGRYGSVCRGILNDHTVAVKIFCYQNRQYFLNERDIYMLPHMEHASLPNYIGSDERIGLNGRPEYLLVVSYSPVGCLQDFLRNTTIDWGRLCKMALSITRGLAHLHTEFGKGEKSKPCVAHRDLTSRNILVKPDGSCMLCDFGFAIRISGSKYFQNGEEQVAENTSLADVGTLRYMAPEILEGAVNLRDCESSLKQIDVYALGLVLWEIGTKCTELYQGVEVPEYKLPFEAEIGLHPSMEQMQVLVVKHKARPLFPDIWKDTNPAVRALKETIEDCWDQDAEARLTTLCVEERLIELPVVWERYKAGLGIPGGVSPTFNATSNIQKSTQALTKASSETDNILDGLDQNDLLICPRDRVNSMSECTVETLLSPSEPPPNNNTVDWKNTLNSNSSVPTAKVAIPLHPHQGRNPCLARNLMPEQPQDEKSTGNSLVDMPTKYTVDRNIRSFSDGDTNIFDVSTTQSNLLASSEQLNHSFRICNPIPYVQNRTVNAITIPKQSNVGQDQKKEPAYKVDRRWGPFYHLFDRKKGAKENIRAGLKSLLERKPSSKSSGNLPEEQQPLKTPGSNCISPMSPVGQSNPASLYWTDGKEHDRLVSTEVRISKPNNSVATVRPLTTTKNPEEKDSSLGREVARSNENAKSSGDSTLSSLEKFKRPSTLPVQGYPDHPDEVEDSNLDDPVKELSDHNHPTITMRRKGSGGRRKGVKRVKTPFEIKGRFSLYDDRIMSSQDLPNTIVSNSTQPQLEGAKFSASVPMDMDALCSSQQVNNNNTVVIHPQKSTELQEYCRVVSDSKAHQNVVSLCDI